MTAHACTGPRHAELPAKQQQKPARVNVDGAWYCPACAPRTLHRNCTHAMGDRGRRCPWCLEPVP